MPGKERRHTCIKDKESYSRPPVVCLVTGKSLSIMPMDLRTYLRVGLTDGLACDDSVVTP